MVGAKHTSPFRMISDMADRIHLTKTKTITNTLSLSREVQKAATCIAKRAVDLDIVPGMWPPPPSTLHGQSGKDDFAVRCLPRS